MLPFSNILKTLQGYFKTIVVDINFRCIYQRLVIQYTTVTYLTTQQHKQITLVMPSSFAVCQWCLFRASSTVHCSCACLCIYSRRIHLHFHQLSNAEQQLRYLRQWITGDDSKVLATPLVVELRRRTVRKTRASSRLLSDTVNQSTGFAFNDCNSTVVSLLLLLLLPRTSSRSSGLTTVAYDHRQRQTPHSGMTRQRGEREVMTGCD